MKNAIILSALFLLLMGCAELGKGGRAVDIGPESCKKYTQELGRTRVAIDKSMRDCLSTRDRNICVRLQLEKRQLIEFETAVKTACAPVLQTTPAQQSKQTPPAAPPQIVQPPKPATPSPLPQTTPSAPVCAPNLDEQCNRNACGGKGVTLCDGTCSALAPAVPSNFAKQCGSCGGTINCEGVCSIATPSNHGSACGCGGTIRCDGQCSAYSCGSGQVCQNNQCVTARSCSTEQFSVTLSTMQADKDYGNQGSCTNDGSDSRCPDYEYFLTGGTKFDMVFRCPRGAGIDDVSGTITRQSTGEGRSFSGGATAWWNGKSFAGYRYFTNPFGQEGNYQLTGSRTCCTEGTVVQQSQPPAIPPQQAPSPQQTYIITERAPSPQQTYTEAPSPQATYNKCANIGPCASAANAWQCPGRVLALPIYQNGEWTGTCVPTIQTCWFCYNQIGKTPICARFPTSIANGPLCQQATGTDRTCVCL